ncbi:hypothetical protein PJM29_30425, partial [Mycobacterium kansasii]
MSRSGKPDRGSRVPGRGIQGAFDSAAVPNDGNKAGEFVAVKELAGVCAGRLDHDSRPLAPDIGDEEQTAPGHCRQRQAIGA